MTKPTCEDMLTAAEWLDVNGSQAKNGDNEEDEMTSCAKVATWLRANIEKADKKRLDEIAFKEFIMSRKIGLKTNCPGPTKQEARAMWKYSQLRKKN